MTGDRVLDGICPIVPTIFDGDGNLDEAGQRATIDFLLRGGVDGLVLLANASEGYAVSDAERTQVIAWAVEHVNGRVPVVVTCNHPSTVGAVRYAQEAQALGAAAVMFLPPFFGQWQADLDGIQRHCEAISRHTAVPLVLQDHPLSGISMPAAFLVELARRVERLAYFKVEAMRAPAKIGQMLRLGRDALAGVFGGTGGILFLEELDQGAVGTMPSSMLPEVFARVLRLYRGGERKRAADLLARHLPLITFETHLGGQRTVKELLALGGTIRSAFVRGPIRSTWDPQTMRTFRALLEGADLLILARPA